MNENCGISNYGRSRSLYHAVSLSCQTNCGDSRNQTCKLSKRTLLSGVISFPVISSIYRISCVVLIATLLNSAVIVSAFDDHEDNAESVVLSFVRHMSPSELHQFAHSHCMEYSNTVLDKYHEFRHGSSCGRTKRETHQALGAHEHVASVHPQVELKRKKRDSGEEPTPPPPDYTGSWADPLYNKMWYLLGGAESGYDMKVREAWALGYTGRGVVSSILDDGIQPDHPDLKENYDPEASTDINGNDTDPTPRDNGDNKHGTRCAGEVSAVAGNDYCGVGVAYHSKIGGVRMLDGKVTDSVEARSLSLHPQHIDIYSASWGPEDDGKTVDGPGPLAKAAFYNGTKHGRNGLGSIFIWASGNGGSHGDSCSCDGYTTSIYTLSVSSATYQNGKPWYLEECPSTITTTYSSSTMGQKAIVTTDMPNSCTSFHTGTSASAPLAAGVVALALEANPKLTWRDVQHIVLRTSDPKPLEKNDGWAKNGVGRLVSNKFGYGLMNAEALVRMARVWKTAPEQHVCTYEYKIEQPVPLADKFYKNFTLAVPGCKGEHAVNFLEQVHAVISAKYTERGALQMTLISPAGTKSVLLPTRRYDRNRNGLVKWPFLSVQQWGEDPTGVWTLIVENYGGAENTGQFEYWALTFYGTAEPPIEPTQAELDAIGHDIVHEPVDQNNQDHSVTIHNDGCHQECDERGCYVQNSASDCVACRNYKMMKSNRGGDVCLPNCLPGFYIDKFSPNEGAQKGICSQCLRECATCTVAERCDTCSGDLKLVQADEEVAELHVHHGRCLDHCPTGFHDDDDDVNVCVLDKVVKDQSSKAEDHHPGECHASCAVCKGTGARDCLACMDGRQLTARGECLLEDGGEPQSTDAPTTGSGARPAGGSSVPPALPSSTFTHFIVGACAAAVLVFLAVFGALMYRDRSHDSAAGGGKPDYTYKPLGKPSNGRFHPDDSDSALSSDVDDDDVLFLRGR